MRVFSACLVLLFFLAPNAFMTSGTDLITCWPRISLSLGLIGTTDRPWLTYHSKILKPNLDGLLDAPVTTYCLEAPKKLLILGFIDILKKGSEFADFNSSFSQESGESHAVGGTDVIEVAN